MSKQIEALKLALEALEYYADMTEEPSTASGAALIVREALAQSRSDVEQPAQQPVAYMNQNGVIHPADYEWEGSGNILTPLYTSPPASKPWVGLTDDEIDECYYWKDRQWTTDELVRHVEAKLREKNAAPCRPLTDDRIWGLKTQFEKDAEMKIPEKPFRHVVRAIEAAHGIKGDA